MGQRRMARVEHAGHVRVDNSVPFLDCHLGDGSEEPDTGVVHQDVQTPETLYDGPDGVFHLLGAPRISPNGEDGRRTTYVFQHRRARPKRCVRGRRDRHLRATLDQCAGHGQTDSTGASGHQSDFAGKHLHALLQYTRWGERLAAPPLNFCNMTTVAIVGAGDIGGATAQALAACDRVRRVWLVDAAADAAAGKALDLQQAGAVAGQHTRLEGTSDENRLVGCAVCVIADRFGVGTSGRQNEEWQGDEGLSMLKRITRCLGDAPIVFAGASHAGLLSRCAGEAQTRRERLVGSSTDALASAITAIVAMEAGCSPREVMLTVLGTPPDGFVVPWSEASIGGYAMQRVLSPVQLGRVEARVARLWPPGPYALGAAAARVTDAIVSNSRRSFSIITQLEGEFGVRRRPGALPARLAAGGIARVRVPELGTREHVRLQTALAR